MSLASGQNDRQESINPSMDGSRFMRTSFCYRLASTAGRRAQKPEVNSAFFMNQDDAWSCLLVIKV